uniref:Uncharacterized protein n=1 Tax=Romanomermis culicivorax TaxID=13658 RepID=A0A915JEY0_ROMCU
MWVRVPTSLERCQRIYAESLPNEYCLHDADYSSYDNALSFLEEFHEEWEEVVESIRAVSQTANNGPSKEELIALFFYMAHLMLPSVATNIHHDLQYGQGVGNIFGYLNGSDGMDVVDSVKWVESIEFYELAM